jgi:hypothetical protein
MTKVAANYLGGQIVVKHHHYSFTREWSILVAHAYGQSLGFYYSIWPKTLLD